MDGPRMVAENEWGALRATLEAVFWPTIVERFPHFFNEANRPHLRVFADGGRIAAHVGFSERDLSIWGGTVKSGSVGAVATLPEYRNQHLATQLMTDVLNQMTADGVEIVLISGGRGLYRRRGCARVGRCFSARITTPSVPRTLGDKVSLRPITEDQLPDVMRLHQQESVRFIRPREDYEYFLQSRWAMSRPCDMFTLWRNARMVAYIVLQTPGKGREEAPPGQPMRPPTGEPGLAVVAEFAGSRTALLAAVPELIERYKLEELRLPFHESDTELAALLAGCALKPVSNPFTTMVLNLPRLLESLRGHCAERLGTALARTLTGRIVETSANEADNVFELACGGERVRVPGGLALSRVIFGTWEEGAQIADGVPPPLPPNLAKLFPLPLPWYGLNYV